MTAASGPTPASPSPAEPAEAAAPPEGNVAAAYEPGTQPESEGEARYEVSAHTSGAGGYEPIER